MLSAPPELAPGAVLADTYRIVRVLGQGGMGLVFEAQHLRVPRRVAIKVLLERPDAELLARFRQEAEIATQLRHDNIVDILDFNTLANGSAYIVMELLEGESLARRIETRGARPAEEVVQIVRQIAAGLTAAHAAGVVHRDLKPENIFLVAREQDGELVDRVKILDFGISKVAGSNVVRTREDLVLGTPRYMSPEQASGEHEALDARTDQFALAVIAYEMLTGRPPWTATQGPQVMFQIVYEPPLPLAPLAPATPPAMIAAIERALAKSRDERFRDLPAFIEALTGKALPTVRPSAPVLDPGAPTVAERPLARAPKVEPRRSRVPLVLGLAIAVAAIVGVAISSLSHTPAVTTTDAWTADATADVRVADTTIDAVIDAAVDAAIVDAGSVADAARAVRSDARVVVSASGDAGAGPTPPSEQTLADAQAAFDAGRPGEAKTIATQVWNRTHHERAAKLLALIGCAEKNLDDATTWGRKVQRHNNRVELRKICRETYNMRLGPIWRGDDGTE